jgi:hypothetical protein
MVVALEEEERLLKNYDNRGVERHAWPRNK